MIEPLDFSCGIIILTILLTLKHPIYGVTTVLTYKHSSVGSTRESWRQLPPYFCMREGIDPSDLNSCNREGMWGGGGGGGGGTTTKIGISGATYHLHLVSSFTPPPPPPPPHLYIYICL